MTFPKLRSEQLVSDCHSKAQRSTRVWFNGLRFDKVGLDRVYSWFASSRKKPLGRILLLLPQLFLFVSSTVPTTPRGKVRKLLALARSRSEGGGGAGRGLLPWALGRRAGVMESKRRRGKAKFKMTSQFSLPPCCHLLLPFLLFELPQVSIAVRGTEAQL